MEKFEAMNKKMNKITTELAKNIELSDDMLTTTDEFAEALESTRVAERLDFEGNELAVNELATKIVDSQAMVSDFVYMRKMLRETTENSRRVLSSVTEELVMAEEENRASLILAYSELNKAQIESIKLFMQSYKEVSTILLNLSKVQHQAQRVTNYTTNVLSVESGGSSEIVSVADVVKRLQS